MPIAGFIRVDYCAHSIFSCLIFMIPLHIYLARHGQDEDNAAIPPLLNGHRNQPLTAIGVEQANALATDVKGAGFSFDAVYSSPLQRAYKTAEAVTDALGIEKPIVIDALIERDFGVMSGQPATEILNLPPEDILITPTINYFLRAEGAETFPDVIERVKVFLAELVTKHKEGDTVLLVCHGDTGKMIYATFYGLDWREVLKQFHFGNSELLLLSGDSPDEIVHVFRAAQYNA